MVTYITYRNGTGPMEERIKAAVRHFYGRYLRLPAVVVVHQAELSAAQEAVNRLALTVPVEGLGGCLVPEVWLGVSDG